MCAGQNNNSKTKSKKMSQTKRQQQVVSAVSHGHKKRKKNNQTNSLAEHEAFLPIFQDPSLQLQILQAVPISASELPPADPVIEEILTSARRSSRQAALSARRTQSSPPSEILPKPFVPPVVSAPSVLPVPSSASAAPTEPVVSVSLHERSMAMADTLIAGKIADSTREHYMSCIKNFRKFCVIHHPDAVQRDQDGAMVTVVEKSLKLPLDQKAVMSFFGLLALDPNGENAEQLEFFRRKGKKEKNLAISPAALGAFRSALAWYCGLQHQELVRELYSKLTFLISGYKKKIAAMKKSGELPAIEGRHHIGMKGYRFLAEKFFQLTPEIKEGNKLNNKQQNSFNESLFAWPYWLLLWNLMQRSETIANLQLEHISWKEDSLTIIMPKTKTDQEGDRSYPRHVYANPLDPQICCVLAIAAVIFSKSFYPNHSGGNLNNNSNNNLENGTENKRGESLLPSESVSVPLGADVEIVEESNSKSWPLFFGGEQNHRMSALMNRVLKKMENRKDLLLFDEDPNFIGLHSPRKGANTYCSSIVGGPSFPSICHRGGWAVGGVQSRYNFPQDGSDQFVGRTVAGLPFTSSQFAVLPPHFSLETLESITSDEWRTILPLYEKYPRGFAICLPYLLASIVYHSDWLRQNLSPNHSLFNCPLFQYPATLNRLRPLVLLGETKCPLTKMEARGLHPILAVAANLGRMTEEVRQTKEDIQTSLAGRLTDCILSKVAVNGAVQMSKDEMISQFKELQRVIKEDARSARELQIVPQPAIALDNKKIVETEGVRYTLFKWANDDSDDEKWRRCPKTFEIVGDNCKSFWNLWWHGDLRNPSELISPHRHFERSDFFDDGKSSQFFKGRKVMVEIEAVARELNLFPADVLVKQIPLPKFWEIFDIAFTELCKRINKRLVEPSSRIGEISFSTMANKIYRWHKAKGTNKQVRRPKKTLRKKKKQNETNNQRITDFMNNTIVINNNNNSNGNNNNDNGLGNLVVAAGQLDAMEID